jgi:hypothetical protein
LPGITFLHYSARYIPFKLQFLVLNVSEILSPPTSEGLDLLSELDMHKYRLQRRQIGPIYAASSIAELDGPLDKILIKIMTSMRQAAGTAVDLDIWCHMLGLGNIPSFSVSRKTAGQA